jgi:uncharacterized protein (TIGR02145 family)
MRNIGLFTIIFLFFLSTPAISKERPFATVEVGKDIYFDETEVDVGSWLSYYTWVLMHKGTDEAQKVLPDSNAVEPEVWKYISVKSNEFFEVQGAYTNEPIGYFRKKCIESKKFGERITYTDDCALIHFPITGVTYEQVISFCQWRTKLLGKGKYIFKLPSQDELKKIALKSLSGNEIIKGTKDSVNEKSFAMYNYKAHCNCWKDSVLGRLMAVGAFPSDNLKLFEVYGNVSEMTSEKGIAKGGNFTLYAKQCHPNSVQHYSKPEIWLGFRCIAVIGDGDIEKADSSNFKKALSQPTDTILWQGKFGKFIDPRDSNEYKIVKINDQIWFAENIRFKPDSGEFWAWENDPSYIKPYGYLYNWETSKDVCPTGWHLPTKEDFEVLIKNVGNGDAKVAFNRLTESGDSGFGLKLYVGTRLGKRNFSDLESVLRSSTQYNNKKSASWAVYYIKENTKFLITSYSNTVGTPVRCIKD